MNDWQQFYQVIRGEDGQPRKLVILSPADVTIIRNEHTGEIIGYAVATDLIRPDPS